MKSPALVLLNPLARGGRGAELWRSVEVAVSERLELHVISIDTQGWQDAVRRALRMPCRNFIAAGGDGTVNALVNAIMSTGDASSLAQLTLGAVGLGSSNDFHKPVRKRVKGIPIKIDFQQARRRDVCLARFRLGNGAWKHHYFLVSGSMGITAEANELFNATKPSWLRLKRHWVGGAIGYAAVRSTISNDPICAEVVADGVRTDVQLANLNVLKSDHISGALRIQDVTTTDERSFGVVLVDALPGWKRIKALIDLARGRLRPTQGLKVFRARLISIRTEKPTLLELDGEIFPVTEVHLSIPNEQIGECQ